ncbi:uncharacterized protein E6C27_scaffold55G002220 [Cucumis melo var. makuwa]|uniref:Uncharacterized protein n=1 Tax=Cucumis melo var. makuwa TaxID=1194695 RepID=A0A5A7UD31_CUCMM|nr:uncharacterized protein E6C27_scaffold55G002220 [Cucumis melo var. makuwa]
MKAEELTDDRLRQRWPTPFCSPKAVGVQSGAMANSRVRVVYVPTQYAYHFGYSSDEGAKNTATEEGIHSFSIDRVSREIALLRANSRA